MKPIFCFPLVLALCAWADETSDRAAVEKVVSALSDPHQRSALFAADASGAAEMAWLAGTTATDQRPWSELAPPIMRSRSIRFITADVASVDAEWSQYGSATARHIPVFLVLKREAGGWKIAALRITTPHW